MSIRSLLRALPALALALAAGAAGAAFDPVNDDTDIFLANPAFTTSRPNVLIFLDNSANWSQSSGAPGCPDNTNPFCTKYGGVRTGLTGILTNVVTPAFNVGLSLFVETGNPNNNIDGAYVRYGIRQMTESNKDKLITMVNGLAENGDKGNNATYSLAMAEMFNYYAGVSSHSGYGKEKTDAGGSIYFPSGRVALAGSPLAEGALPASGGTVQTYVSPITDACQKNFIVVISNGEAADNAASLSTAEGFLSSITGTSPPAVISISPNGEQGLWSDEYARFMANSDCNLNIQGTQTVITYTIDIVPGTTGRGPSHTAMLKSMASNGKGKYFAITDMSNAAQLEDAFKSIFEEVQAVNSVFASTTLPVSVNVRGTNLNQVYIGVFRPDPNKSPRWLGNLKLYKLGVDTATQNLFLADATGAPAENAATGFISATATSFWTAPSTFWTFSNNGVACSPAASGVCSDAPDGDLVEKGGAAQRLRVAYPTSNAARNLYTCLDTTLTGACATTGLSSTLFNTANVSPGDVGAFFTYGINSLTWDSNTNLATMVLSAAPSPAWSDGNTVRVAGVTPAIFNGDFPINVVDSLTYTYTLSPGPDSNRARINAPNHLLTAGDYVYVSANPSGFSTFFTDAFGNFNYVRPITRVDANNFDYDLNSPQTSAASSFVSYGLRLIGSVRGLVGDNQVLISLPGHGLGAAGATISCAYLMDALLESEWYSAFCQTATVVDADTIRIPINYPPIGSGAAGAVAPNAAQVTAPNHGYSTGNTVTISGSLVNDYNGAKSITRLDANTFGFASAQVFPDSSANMRVGAVISTIVHDTSGSGSGCNNSGARDTATVTTATPHNLLPGGTVAIFDTGTFNTVTNTFAGYDGTWVVQSAPSATTFTIFNACVDQVAASLSPVAGLAGFAISSITPIVSTSVSNTGRPLYVWRYLANAVSDRPLSNGSGIMKAGRPSDVDTAQRDLIVNWARSTDNIDNEDLNGIATDVRASVHGDVLHSRPATINYSRYGDDNDVYAFYGSNDGILHAVKGGIAAHTTGADTGLTPGIERWGFIPSEFFGKLKRLREQSPTISNLNQKDYFFDGSIGVYQKDVAGSGNVASPGAGTVTGVIGDNAGDKIYLYVSLRRGGNFIYALDVTDPANPKLLWRRGRGDTGWGEVAQTWSEPKITRVTADIGNPSNPDNVVLIFAAGYNEKLEDINPCLLQSWTTADVVQKPIGAATVTYTSGGSCIITNPGAATATTFSRATGNPAGGTGRGILVVDAFSGNVVWQVGPAPADAANNLTMASMTCAISSDVTVLDKNRDGFADRLYAGDLCGNVWRADLTNPTIANWAITQIANLSGTVATTLSDKRKFMFPPDLVFGTDATGNYTAVLLGSGDREHPFDTSVQNAFFMIKDRDDPNPSNPTAGIPNHTTKSIATPPDPDNLLLLDPVTTASLFDATSVIVDGTDPTSLNGWLVNLLPGEKVIGSAVTIAGTTFFNTNQPSSTAGGLSCGSNLGIAREYLIGFADAAATVDLQGTGTLSVASRFTVHAGGGYLPSPVPVVVEIGGKKYQAVISGTSVRQPPGTELDTRIRTYWYKDLD